MTPGKAVVLGLVLTGATLCIAIAGVPDALLMESRGRNVSSNKGIHLTRSARATRTAALPGYPQCWVDAGLRSEHGRS